MPEKPPKTPGDTSAAPAIDVAHDINPLELKRISTNTHSPVAKTLLKSSANTVATPTSMFSYQYLGFFSEDDKELEATRQAYIKGELLTGELKKKCFVKLQEFVKAYQGRRATITEEVVDGSMKVRPLIWGQYRATQPDPAQMQRK